MFKAIATILCIALIILASPAQEAGGGTVVFVDGTKTDCEILFKHPNCNRLVVRSSGNSTVQTFDLSQIQAVIIKGRRTGYGQARALTQEEKNGREADRLWADEVGKGQIGRYASQSWDRRPLMVWAKPGESGDALTPASWLDEEGRPFTTLPWIDEAKPDMPPREAAVVDVLMPAGDKPYKALQAGNPDTCRMYAVRHLTVEQNAGYHVAFSMQGNLWLKAGGDIRGWPYGHLGSRYADKDTFARFCEVVDRTSRYLAKGTSHYVNISTGAKGSLEIIGASGGAADRLTVEKGTLIVSEDSFLGNGNRACFYSMPGTTTILLDGAEVGCPSLLVADDSATYGIAGTIMFGTKEHPLTRDLPFGGCYLKPGDRQSQAISTLGDRTKGASFVLGKTGRMEIHSRDPAKARVVFCPRPRDAPVGQEAIPRSLWRYHVWLGERHANGAPKPELWDQPELPKYVFAVFAGETDFNGVVFDGFATGGISVSSAARAAWRNVSFGQRNQGPPDSLFLQPAHAARP